MMFHRSVFVLIFILNFENMKSFAQKHPRGDQLTEVPNKFRYAKISKSSPTSEQVVYEYGARLKPQQDANSCQVQKRDLRETETISSDSGALDKEDKFLLDRFYRDNKDAGRSPYGALFDYTIPYKEHNTEDHLPKEPLHASRWHKFKPRPYEDLFGGLFEPISISNWTIDPYLLSMAYVGSPLGAFSYSRPSIMTPSSDGIAKYSPVHRLLTSYDPIEEQLRVAIDTDQKRGGRANRVSGATLHGRTQSPEQMVSSKSAEKAVRLHDEMFRNPPRDGIARVRMYFHRAIHDDVKLYGTGPWKYWGHGWGLEYGFDPKNLKNPSLYQKGYTIERAYGRDFCKDKKNCRPPDPNFFREMPKPGVDQKK